MVIKLSITIRIEEFHIAIWDKAILELLCFSATKTRELVKIVTVPTRNEMRPQMLENVTILSHLKTKWALVVDATACHQNLIVELTTYLLASWKNGFVVIVPFLRSEHIVDHLLLPLERKLFPRYDESFLWEWFLPDRSSLDRTWHKLRSVASRIFILSIMLISEPDTFRFEFDWRLGFTIFCMWLCNDNVIIMQNFLVQDSHSWLCWFRVFTNIRLTLRIVITKFW